MFSFNRLKKILVLGVILSFFLQPGIIYGQEIVDLDRELREKLLKKAG